MATTARDALGADPDLIDPELEGLDDTFDAIIRGFPQSLIEAGDAHVLDPAFSRDPLTPLTGVRDRWGFVVRGENGVFGDLRIPDGFGIDLAKPHFAVFGIEELDQMTKDPRRFSNKGAYGLLGETMGVGPDGTKVGTIPTVEDGAEHERLRDVYDAFLNQQAMARRSDRLIRPICEWLINRIIGKLRRGEDACLCRDLAIPLTYKAMSTMLGVPQSRLTEFVRLGGIFFNAPHHPEEAMNAAGELFRFFLEEVEKRKREPKKDVITFLLEVKDADGRRYMSDDDIAVAARFILPAGIDTTWRGLALVLFALLAHPEQYAEVARDPDKLVRRAVEEGMRWAPSGFVVPRVVRETTTVGGVDVPEGAHVTAFQGVANRDPRRWDDPDVFDIHRKSLTHRTFNSGTHSCAGQHLARLEMVTCVDLFVRRVSDLRLAVDPADVEVHGLQIRSPMRVPVRLAS